MGLSGNLNASSMTTLSVLSTDDDTIQGVLYGKINPPKLKIANYQGLTTASATVIVDNTNYTIAVNVLGSSGVILPATTTTLGGVIIGDGITVDSDGKISIEWIEI